MTKLTDEAILYQIEKVDSGGAISDLVEDRIAYLIEEWKQLGIEDIHIEEDETSPHYGDLRLPDGRYVMWSLTVEIVNPQEET